MTQRVVFIRHSRSCANYRRETDEDAAASQMIRDPGLTEHGLRAARAYGPVLRARLAAVGVRVENAIVGASELRRAQETAAALFGRGASPEDLKNQGGLTVFPHFTEYGAIPENTPVGQRYAEPDLERFLEAVRKRVGSSGRPVIVVGHGSFLKTKVWPTLTGREWRGPFRNLDAFVVDMSETGSQPVKGTVIRYTGVPMNTVEEDRCRVKIAAPVREMRRTKKYNRQRGGGSMPLAWYSQGAQMVGTRGYETGVGLAQPESGWVRAPLVQTQFGGRRKQQRGGFSPAVMGSFATTGLRLLPIAAYMGHRMVKNSRKVHRKRATRRK